MKPIWQLLTDMGYYLGCIDLTVENGQLIECQVEAIPTKSYILDLDKEDEAFIKAMREEGHRRLAQKKVANLGRELDLMRPVNWFYRLFVRRLIVS